MSTTPSTDVNKMNSTFGACFAARVASVEEAAPLLDPPSPLSPPSPSPDAGAAVAEGSAVAATLSTVAVLPIVVVRGVPTLLLLALALASRHSPHMCGQDACKRSPVGGVEQLPTVLKMESRPASPLAP